MRKLVVIEFLSLDGVMQSPGSPDEDTEGGFRQGGWAGPYIDEVFGAAAVAGMAETDAQLFGRKTYEIMAAYWPAAPSDDPYATHLNSVRKYVASRTLDRVDWHNSTLLEGDVATAVAELKEQPGENIAVLGSGDLVQTLIEHDPRGRVLARGVPGRARQRQAAVPRGGADKDLTAARREADEHRRRPAHVRARPLSAASLRASSARGGGSGLGRARDPRRAPRRARRRSPLRS
jgi:dihydrofolate reductase